MRHIYLHIPFCTHICPYCSFYKHKNDSARIRAFLYGLRSDIQLSQDSHTIQPETIYMGGGTPTALSTLHWEELFSMLPWRDAVEFTVEANPETVTPAKARYLRSMGVNRISLGVQSFHPAHLKLLGRTHNEQSVRRAIQTLRDAGFENINIDLMFALPGQTVTDWADSLACALSLHPAHISAYNLTYEEDTEFLARHQKGEFRKIESMEKEMFHLTIETLEQAGLYQYEVSNFAQPGFESRHNQAYWRGEDYLGLGPGAVGTCQLLRTTKIADTLAYGQHPAFTTETLTPQCKQNERIMLGLRTRHGIPNTLLNPSHETVLAALCEEGMLTIEQSRVILTRHGLAVADNIAQLLIE